MQRSAFFQKFEANVRANPTALAIESAQASLTYDQLNARANALAAALAGLTAPTGTPKIIGLAMAAGPDYIVGMFGVGKAGAAFAPLPPDLPPLRLRSYLERTAPMGVVAPADAVDALRARLNEAGLTDLPIIALPAADATDPGNPNIKVGPGEPAYVMFTSGSTGEPKAILGQQRGLSHFLAWELSEFGLDASTRGTWLAPVSFDVSLRDVLVPLMSGGTVCIPDPDVRVTPHRLVDWIMASRANLIHCVPSALRLILRELEARNASAAHPSFPALRHLLIAGEPLYGADITDWRRIAGGHTTLVNLYGPSETTLAKIFFRVGDAVFPDRQMLPIGTPLPNTDVFILDGDYACPAGDVGEIHIRTPYRSLGYLGAPEQTAASFITHPLYPDSVLYRTGDLGRIGEDGLIECLGRLDNQVKINGIRIEPGEVEAALRRVSTIRDAAVTVHEHAGLGKMLVAYYTRRDGIDAPLAEGALQTELLRYLPEALLPRLFVPLEEMPRTVSGKINRKALPMAESLFYANRDFVAPATETEETLAKQWGELFGLKRIGVVTPFRDFGGDSLRAIKALSAIYHAFAVELTLKDFFDAPTIREQAEIIDGRLRDAPAVAPIPRLDVAGHYPTSAAQRRLWRLQRMGIAPHAYNLTESYRIEGALDLDRLDAALQLLVARHEALRTTFAEIDSEPRQVVGAPDWSLRRVDLRSDAHATATADALLEQEREFIFDLEHGPLFRVTAVSLPEQDGQAQTLLVLVLHHIISDVRSLQILAEELAVVYQALADRQPVTLPELSLQYRDFAAWQAGRLHDDSLGGDRAYWTAQLARPLPLLDLPSDRPRPRVQTFNGTTERLVLEAALLDRLKGLAESRGVTLFALLISLVGTVLHRYTGQNDIIVGAPVLGRDHHALEQQVGYYVNTVALRLNTAGDRPFAALLDDAGQRVGEALEHQSYPFDDLVEALALPRDMSRSPLFDVMVVAQTFDEFELSLPGVTVHRYGADNAWNFSRFDLVYHFQEMDGALVLDLNYNTDLFDRARILRYCDHVAALARAVIADSNTALDRLSVLSGAEVAVISAATTGPVIERSAPHDIPTRFAAEAATHSDRLALISQERNLSFAQALAEIDHLAGVLIAEQGVQPGDRVAVLAHRSVDSVLAMLAIQRAGAVYVPIDPDYPSQRIALMLARAEARLALADQADDLTLLADSTVTGLTVAALRARPAVTVALPAINPDEAAYIIFTSGSTGIPKAVEVAHRGFVNMSLGQIETFGLGAEDRVLQFASPSFDASLANLFMALFAGGAVVLPDADAIRAPDRLLAWMEQTGTTCVTLPPTYLRALGGTALPSSLKVLISAGEAAAVPEMVRHAQAGLRVFNAYGPTEASVCATIHAVTPETSADLPRLSIGKPLPNTSVLILDDHFTPVPVGVTGMLYLGGAGLALGYRNDPERTAAAFVTHPRTGERLYRTGDLARWLSDGTVDFIGRNDDQVKVRGFRIETGEIEQALRQIPGVRDACIDLVTLPNGETTVLGYYTPAPLVELWPSIAEFYVYDDIVHTSMERDEGRNRRYRESFARHLPGKVVVDIGTGPFAVLARLAAEAGASKVYAIELLERSFIKATDTIRQLGLEDKITVVHGDARSVRLPELADWCISEIVGSIGGAEGAAVIIEQARPLLKDGSKMIPCRSLTKIAACSLPDETIGWGFSEIANHYVKRIFEQVGRSFDLRLCIKEIPDGAMISNADVFEDLDYTQTILPEVSHQIDLQIDASASLTGFVVWLTLDIDPDLTVDILDSKGSWLPIYIPAFPGGVSVAAGDRITATIHRTLDKNGLNPDFRIEGQVLTAQGSVPFVVDSPNAAQGFRETPFYQRLFAEGEYPQHTAVTPASARQHLAKLLPAHAIPHRLMELEHLPMTVNGKLDRAALPKHGLLSGGAGRSVAIGIEATVAELWKDIIGLDQVSAEDDFFAVGGDSIRAIQVVGRLRQKGYAAEVRMLFQYPRLASFAANLKALDATQDTSRWSGDVPLSPVQSWFLRRFAGHEHHFNQSVQIIADGRMDKAAVQSGLDLLWQRHDLLRARFTQTESGWEQSIDSARAGLSLREISVQTDADYAAAAEAVHQSFRIDQGGLFAAVLAHFPTHDRLLLVAHHLVVDMVSWTILTEDLLEAIAAAERGEAAADVTATTHYGAYADALHRYAQAAPAADLAGWQTLPALSAPSAQGTGGTGSLSRRLDTDTTFALQESGVSLQNLLLASLVDAVAAHTGQAQIGVTLELHGRDLDWLNDYDLSRSVGWFTTFHPLIIDSRSENTLAAVDQALTQLPQGGRNWLALSEFADPTLRDQAAWIGFNYLGVLGGEDQEAGLRVDWTPPGTPVAPDAPVLHGLELLGCITDGQLELSLTFDGQRIDQAGATAVVNAMITDLQQRLSSGMRAFTAGVLDSDDLAALLEDE